MTNHEQSMVMLHSNQAVGALGVMGMGGLVGHIRKRGRMSSTLNLSEKTSYFRKLTHPDISGD